MLANVITVTTVLPLSPLPSHPLVYALKRGGLICGPNRAHRVRPSC